MRASIFRPEFHPLFKYFLKYGISYVQMCLGVARTTAASRLLIQMLWCLVCVPFMFRSFLFLPCSSRAKECCLILLTSVCLLSFLHHVWTSGRYLLTNDGFGPLISEKVLSFYVLYRSIWHNNEVNNTDHHVTVQYSEGKPWILALLWMPLDTNHLSKHACRSSP